MVVLNPLVEGDAVISSTVVHGVVVCLECIQELNKHLVFSSLACYDIGVTFSPIQSLYIRKVKEAALISI